MIYRPFHAVSLVLMLIGSIAVADEQYEPSDPIAAVNGNPIYYGELNLVLSERLGHDKMERVGIDAQKATALIVGSPPLGNEVAERIGRRRFEEDD